MQDISANNKRIAKNTFALYFRMALILVVTLYTSRVVLAYLGVVDYGVYNVVGGVVLLFSFINSSMSTSTQRFLTFELGKKHYERLHRTFAASLNVHVFLGLAIVILAESVGLWFVTTHMVIPSDRLFAANIVYQCSIFSFFISITQVPYNASLIAHEKMDVYAYLSVLAENNAVFAIIPPVTALLESQTLERECVAWPELGMEALYRIKVDNYQAIIAAAKGKSIYD